jgi:hypothetical protein
VAKTEQKPEGKASRLAERLGFGRFAQFMKNSRDQKKE